MRAKSDLNAEFEAIRIDRVLGARWLSNAALRTLKDMDETA